MFKIDFKVIGLLAIQMLFFTASAGASTSDYKFNCNSVQPLDNLNIDQTRTDFALQVFYSEDGYGVDLFHNGYILAPPFSERVSEGGKSLDKMKVRFRIKGAEQIFDQSVEYPILSVKKYSLITGKEIVVPITSYEPTYLQVETEFVSFGYFYSDFFPYVRYFSIKENGAQKPWNQISLSCYDTNVQPAF